MALRYEDMLERLGSQGRSAVLNTYRLYTAGLIDRHTFLEVSSELLQHINERGRAYGRLSYENASAIMQDMEPALDRAAKVEQPNTRPHKIREALQTVVDGEPEQIEQRLARLGYVLPIDETYAGYAAELQADDVATGWTRLLDGEGCELCEWWSRDGRVWPKLHPMPRHKGCKCQQIPEYATAASSTEYTRKLERREQAIANRDRRSVEVRELMDSGEM